MNKLEKNKSLFGKKELQRDFPNKLDMKIIMNKDNEKFAVKKFIKERLSDDLARAMKRWFLCVILWGALLVTSAVLVLLGSYMFGINTLIPLSFTVIGCYLTGVSLVRKKKRYKASVHEKQIKEARLLDRVDILARFALFVVSYREYLKFMGKTGCGSVIEISLPMIAVSAVLLGLYFRKSGDMFYRKILILHGITEDDVEYIYNDLMKGDTEED